MGRQSHPHPTTIFGGSPSGRTTITGRFPAHPIIERCPPTDDENFDEYDFTALRLPAGYTREQLTDLEFARRAENLVLSGDVGTGKTHLAIALAVEARNRGLRARFFSTAALVMHLRRAKSEGRLDRELAILSKFDILAIDEFGYLHRH